MSKTLWQNTCLYITYGLHVLTSEPYWFHFPNSSCQYQSHSVVWMKVGSTKEFTVASLRTLFSPRVIVSKCTGGLLLLQRSKGKKHSSQITENIYGTFYIDSNSNFNPWRCLVYILGVLPILIVSIWTTFHRTVVQNMSCRDKRSKERFIGFWRGKCWPEKKSFTCVNLYLEEKRCNLQIKYIRWP